MPSVISRLYKERNLWAMVSLGSGPPVSPPASLYIFLSKGEDEVMVSTNPKMT